MIPVVWLPEADAELKETLERHESIRPELGQRFLLRQLRRLIRF